MEARDIPMSEKTVIFVLTLGKPGDKKKVKKSEVQVNAMVDGQEVTALPPTDDNNEESEPNLVNPDQDMMTVHKDILQSPELKAIGQFHGKIRKWIANEGLPCETLKAGMTMLNVSKVIKVENQMKKFLQELEPLKEAFREAYPARVSESFAKLGALANAMDYPDTDEIMAEFKCEHFFLTFSVPTKVLGRLSTELAEAEERKLAAHFQGAQQQIEKAFAISLQQFINRLRNGLTPTDGKKRRVTTQGIEAFNKFFEVFNDKNISGNGELAEMVTRAHNLVNSATVEEMNQNPEIHTLIASQMNEIASMVDSFITTRSPNTRMIHMPVEVSTTQEETDADRTSAE